MLESNYAMGNKSDECLGGGLRIMSDNELLLAISQIMDTKLDAHLKPIENCLQRIEVDLLENNVLPRLNTLEKCYTSTYERYKDNGDKMEAVMDDISVIKKVVIEHSGQLAYLTKTVDEHTEEFKKMNKRVDSLENAIKQK